MNRLIRAEWYRFLHSGAVFRILLLCCVALLLFPLAQDMNFMNQNLTENLGNIAVSFMMFTMFVPLVVTIAVTNNYTKRTAYYEVMAGNKIGHMIGSKLVIEGLLVGILVYVAMISLGVVVALKNGVGNSKQWGVNALLLFVICLHVTFVSVLIGLAVKNIAGAMVTYLRFAVLELIIEMVLPLLEIKEILSAEACKTVQKAFLMNQLSAAFMPEIASDLVYWIVGCFVAEVVFWWLIVYYTMKKRLYR